MNHSYCTYLVGRNPAPKGSIDVFINLSAHRIGEVSGVRVFIQTEFGPND